MNRYVAGLLVACLAASPAWAAPPNVRVVEVEATYLMADTDTLSGAEENALTRAKRKAAEEVGVYIEASSQDIEKEVDGRTSRINSLSVRTIAAAIIETQILEKRRAIEGDRLAFYIKIKATVSLDTLEEAIKRQKAYEQLSDHHRQLHTEYSELKAELEELRDQRRNTSRMVAISGAVPQNRRAAMDLINSAVRNRNLPEKIDLATQAVTTDGTYVDAYIVRGQTYLGIASVNAKKNTRSELNVYVERAVTDFNRALELAPENTWALLGRGDAYTWQKKSDEAVRDYERLLDIDPLFDVAQQRLITLRTSMARKQVAARQWKQALATLDQILRPDTAQSWIFREKEAFLLRSQVYTELGQLQRAVEDLTTVMRVDPTNQQALLSRAKLFQRLQQNRAAKDDFERACALGSDEACLIVSPPTSQVAP